MTVLSHFALNAVTLGQSHNFLIRLENEDNVGVSKPTPLSEYLQNAKMAV